MKANKAQSLANLFFLQLWPTVVAVIMDLGSRLYTGDILGDADSPSHLAAFHFPPFSTMHCLFGWVHGWVNKNTFEILKMVQQEHLGTTLRQM